MSLLRCYSEAPIDPEGTRIQLGHSEAQHLFKVRRARPSDRIQVLDGLGRIASGHPEEDAGVRHPAIRIESVETVPQRLPQLELVVALPKGKTMDAVVARATELGAARIIPVLTSHSEVRLDDRRAREKQERWTQDAIESIKQCGTPWCPQIAVPSTLDAFLEAEAAKQRRAPVAMIVAALQTGARPIVPLLEQLLQKDPCPKTLQFWVGPEGDFSTEEYESLAEAGAHYASLGRNVLRVETAVAAILAIASALLDNV